jgi:hypothetical protein
MSGFILGAPLGFKKKKANLSDKKTSFGYLEIEIKNMVHTSVV